MAEWRGILSAEWRGILYKDNILDSHTKSTGTARETKELNIFSKKKSFAKVNNYGKLCNFVRTLHDARHQETTSFLLYGG